MFSIEVEPMIKILIADDHAIVREGLKQILSGTPDMVVAAEAANGTEALDRISKNDLDLVVLDIGMPGRSGLDILKEIKSQRPELPVLILSMYPEEQYAARVLKAGASGYLSKESAPDDLVKAIRQISQGKKYISPTLCAILALERD
jgi:two-component system, NarL family, invasion response regulator UvrY